MEYSKTHNTQDVFASLDDKVELLYRYQSIMGEYSSIPHDYGIGFLMSEVEAHTLGYIEQEEGLTSKRLSEITNRTKGTISQTVSSLEKQELIYKQVNPDNKREQLLFVTEKGKWVCSQHRAYDREATFNILNELLKTCTSEEIDAFFKVLYYRSQILSGIMDREKKLYKQKKK